MKYLYSEWGDYTIGKEIIGATIFLGVFPLIIFLFSIPTPIQNFDNFDNFTKKEFFVTVIFTSLVFFSIIYALFYFIISKKEKLISKYPIFSYILVFCLGFCSCSMYFSVFIEIICHGSYGDAPVIFFFLLFVSIIILLVGYYKFNNFFINFMDANFNLRDKHWDAYNLDNKYYKNSWVAVFSAMIVLSIIGVITGNKYLLVVVFCYFVFLGGTYFLLASISCIICSYKERKEKLSN